MRAIVCALAGLLLAVGILVPKGDDDHSGICVGSMQIVACVPPDAQG